MVLTHYIGCMVSLRDAIVLALAGELAKPVGDLTDGASWDSLGADSLDVLGCISAVEQATGVIIPPEALDGILTVGDLVAYVASLRMVDSDKSLPV